MEMRRKDRQLGIDETIEILNKSEYGVLSTVDQNNIPYGVPINFVYIDGVIYFHCAEVGHKLSNIKQNNNVCFTVTNGVYLIPEKFSTVYSSAILFGKISVVEDKEEKVKGLEALIRKLSPDYIEDGLKYIERSADNTTVLKMEIKEMTGKARK